MRVTRLIYKEFYIVLLLFLIGCNPVDDDKTQEKNIEKNFSTITEEVIDDISINNSVNISSESNFNYFENDVQRIVGIKNCKNTKFMLTPYNDSIILYEINESIVKVISSGENDYGEKWLLVENLDAIKTNKYGYIKEESVYDVISLKYDFSDIYIEEKINDVAIGDTIETVISTQGRDYYIVKDSNAYQLGYDDEDGHFTITFDQVSMRVIGLRTTSKRVSMSNSVSIGDELNKVMDIYSENNIITMDSQILIDLGSGFILSIQVQENESQKSLIKRIDIMEDFHNTFKG